MKFLLDENADRRLVLFLKQRRLDVTVIGEDYLASLLDQEVLAIAYQEKRILITNDRSDFGKLIFRDHFPHSGVILFRLKAETGNLIFLKERLQHVLSNYTSQLNNFIVVTPQRVRVSKTERKRAA